VTCFGPQKNIISRKKKPGLRRGMFSEDKNRRKISPILGRGGPPKKSWALKGIKIAQVNAMSFHQSGLIGLRHAPGGGERGPLGAINLGEL